MLVFLATAVALVVWVGGFGYYTGIRQMLEEVKESRLNTLEIIKTNSFASDDSLLTETKFTKQLDSIKLHRNETLLVTDNNGNIISKMPDKQTFETQTENISNILKSEIKNKFTGSIYDNINQNVISFKNINDQYTLIYLTNISKNTERMTTFWIWFSLFLVIDLSVAMINASILSVWMGFSINNLRKLFEKLAKNDFSENATKDSEDELGIISEKYNIFIIQIRELIISIQNSSVSVLAAGNQLSSISQQLSQSNNEQASSTEEIATSMEQMLAMINSNVQNAKITGKSSEKSATEMKRSNEIFIQTIKSVSKISKKISIISEIADKTDILSINAAIEAARAGDTGRGFSVVANEIRKLADKTKTASDEITELSRNGQDISKIAGEKLEQIIPEILKSAKLVNNIVSASQEQQSGIENINTSIQQLTEITNENSASAEEMSASAEELSAQAEQLKELISVFKIGNLQNEDRIIKQENRQTENVSDAQNNGFKLNLSGNDNLNDDNLNDDNLDNDNFEKY